MTLAYLPTLGWLTWGQCSHIPYIHGLRSPPIAQTGWAGFRVGTDPLLCCWSESSGEGCIIMRLQMIF